MIFGKKGCTFIAGLLFLTLFSALILNLPKAMADDDSIDYIEIDVPIACSMTGTVNTPHTETIMNNSLEEDIGVTNFKVVCNDSLGYAIYAIGFTDDTYGKTVLTSSTLGSTYDIATGLATSGNTSNWAMKLSKTGASYAPIIVGSTDDNEKTASTPNFSSYAVVPSEYTKVVYFPSTTDTGPSASGSNFTSTYRVFISGTQPAGTYVGQVKYTLVHPSTEVAPLLPLDPTLCPRNSICYAPNASDIIGSMSSLGTTTDLTNASSSKAGKISASSNAEINLIAPNYKREGYGFAGWSTDFEATSSSTIYGPNETITVPDVSAQGLILYPVWIASTGNLQGADGQGWTGCSSLTTATYNSTTGKMEATLASMTALTDTRDNNVYAVARLADGKCWMVENLRLNAENTRGDTNKAKAQGYGDATANDQGKFIGLADSEDSNFVGSSNSATDATAANSIYYAGTQSGTATIDISQTNYASYRMPRYNNDNTNRNLTASRSGSGNYQWYSYGNYYSWAAAIANTGHYTSYSSSDAAGTSICPKGWKLPLGATSSGNIDQGESDTANRVGSFSYLDRKLGGAGTNQSGDAANVQSRKWRSFPNNFIYSGSFEDSSAKTRSSFGHYWSSSALSTDSVAYFLYLGSHNFYPSYNNTGRYTGRSVRCIVQ
jgi:uncharacterized protein (TIGR02145 family)